MLHGRFLNRLDLFSTGTFFKRIIISLVKRMMILQYREYSVEQPNGFCVFNIVNRSAQWRQRQAWSRFCLVKPKYGGLKKNRHIHRLPEFLEFIQNVSPILLSRCSILQLNKFFLYTIKYYQEFRALCRSRNYLLIYARNCLL